MSTLTKSHAHKFLPLALLILASSQVQNCGTAARTTDTSGKGGSSGSGSGSAGSGSAGSGSAGSGGAPVGSGGRATTQTGGTSTAAQGGGAGIRPAGGGGSSGQTAGTGGRVSVATTGGAPSATGGSVGRGGSPSSNVGGSSAGETVVAMLQSTKAKASELTEADIRTLVRDAVSQAGGLEFIKDGQTVVLKPNLLTTTVGSVQLAPEVNGITTDYRVTKAVAEMVREENPSGKILVMEGSIESTTQAFTRLGYTAANFGSLVDEFIALEGSSCNDRTRTGIIERPAAGGKSFWVNERYFNADVIISLAVLKTHGQAGVTGAVKNLGIGATPASQYSPASGGCGRDQTKAIPHDRVNLAQFIHDFYSVRPADFAIIDGLQGVQNGPSPAWTAGGDYNKDQMNMRLILASKNAVALDTVEAQVIGCDPAQVGYLTLLKSSGFGGTNPDKIRVLGKQIAEVRKPFKGPTWACSGS